MDNATALAQIKTPEVPDDFNGGVGVDFARALMQLLSGAQFTIASSAEAEPFDAAALQAAVEKLQDSFDNNVRGQRKVEMSGVDNGEIIIPFQDIGTTEYDFNWTMITPTGVNPPTVTVALVEGSQQSNQCRVRIDGAGFGYKFIFVITQIRERAASEDGSGDAV